MKRWNSKKKTCSQKYQQRHVVSSNPSSRAWKRKVSIEIATNDWSSILYCLLVQYSMILEQSKKGKSTRGLNSLSSISPRFRNTFQGGEVMLELDAEGWSQSKYWSNSDELAVKVDQAHTKCHIGLHRPRNIDSKDVLFSLAHHQDLTFCYRILEDEVFHWGLLDSPSKVQNVPLDRFRINGFSVFEMENLALVLFNLVEHI